MNEINLATATVTSYTYPRANLTTKITENLFAVHILIRYLSECQIRYRGAVSPRGMQDTQLCYGNRCDFREVRAGVREPASCRMPTTSRANATMCAPHVHTYRKHARLYTRASYQRRASRRRNKFEFPMPPVKFPYQYPDYICITVHGRPATRDGDTTSALVKMRESARYSLLSPSETSDARQRAPIRYKH